MNPHELMEGFSKRLKAAEKELAASEKRAKKLSEKHAAVCSERESLGQQIHEHERVVGSLQGQRSDLQGEWSEASFNGDTAAQRAIQNKRAELDKDIRSRQSELEELRTSLAELEDNGREIAEQVVNLEAIEFGAAWSFATQLRNELVNYVHALDSRRADARRILPSVHPEILEAVKEELVEGYAAEKQRQADEVEQARQERQRKEEEARQRANQQFVGTGEGGRPRATTIGEATKMLRGKR